MSRVEPDGLRDETADQDVDQDTDGAQHRRDESLRGLGVDVDHLHSPVRVDPWNAAASGPLSMAANQIRNNFFAPRQKLARSGPLRAVLVEATTATHVHTTDHDTLLDTLRQHGVAYLTGEEGTGRQATACAVLAELCGNDRVVAIDLNDDADLSAVLDQDGVLVEGHGHVLELAVGQPVPRKQTLTTAGGRLDEHKGYLVVIGGPGDAPDPYAVAHYPPAAGQVLERHVVHLLRTGTGWPGRRAAEFARTCRADEAVAAQLRKSVLPGEVVLLARRLVETVRRGGQPAEAVDLLPGALRDLARDVLRGAANDGGENGGVDTLRRLTTRIAYAVYNGSRHTVVFELAAKLLDALPPEDPEDPEDQARTVFDGGMENLIDPLMRGGPGDESADRARLVDPELARAVLDIAWHGYDHLRAPMLSWLGELGGDPREPVRMRAGQVAGQLAIYDFGVVYHWLLRPWAVSERKVHRQAAAWAMERAVLEPAVTSRACRQVRDWSFSSDPFLNDTAARCYATRLGSEFADDALVNLWLIACRPEHVVSHAVARAIAHGYRPDEPESGPAILEELVRWVCDGERRLHVHAGRALTFLAHRPAPPPDDRWPALLRLAGEDRVAWRRLIRLWRTTLTEPMTAARSWEALLVWLVRANERGELDEVTERFAGELLGDPAVRRRAQFHLAQWLLRHPDMSILRRLRDNLRKG